MLPNPFTPSRIANKPQDFFGRQAELAETPRAIRQGSIVLDGPIGIGKSSLLSQIILRLENSVGERPPLATVYPIVCDGSLKGPEDVASRILSEITDPREHTKKAKFILPKLFEYEAATTSRPADASRSLRAICELLTAAAREHHRLVVVALDEADKCPSAVAQFVRVVLTRTELDQSGLDQIRFVIAGVAPFYNTMIDTDAGVARFVYQRYSLPPFSIDEATSFLTEKFTSVLDSAEAEERGLTSDDALYDLVARVSGGHPHLLQLIGSYILDHEEADPDNRLSAKDLVGCFHRICYQSRGPVYEKILHTMALEGKLDAFRDLLSVADAHCPTHIQMAAAAAVVEDEALHYFVAKGILSFDSGGVYRLNDEFLRIRMLLDDPDTNKAQLENRLLMDRRYMPDDPRHEESEGEGFIGEVEESYVDAEYDEEEDDLEEDDEVAGEEDEEDD